MTLSNQLLEDKVMELRKEINELQMENCLLKAQLSSKQSIETENLDLNREVDNLRREYQSLSLSSDLLMTRLEELLSDEHTSDL